MALTTNSRIQEEKTDLCRRKPSRPRRRSRRRSRNRQASKSTSRSRKARSMERSTYASFHQSNSLFALAAVWLSIHVIVGTMIIVYKTTVAHNVVAVFFITPEFSLERMEIYYLFKKKCHRNSRGTVIFLAYVLVVGLAMGVIGAVMWCLLMLSTVFDVTYILLAIVILLILLSNMFGLLEMAKVFCWVTLLGLATYYVRLGLTLVPVLYTLMLAACVVDNIIARIVVQ